MSDMQKNMASPSMPVQAHQTGRSSRSSDFLPTYEQHVNDNMRQFGSTTGPTEAFDRIVEPKPHRSLLQKKRAIVFIFVGVLVMLGAIIAGVTAWKVEHGGSELRQSAEVVIVTQTVAPTSSSSVSTTTVTKTTTAMTTAPIPKSIAEAASSYYGAMSSSIALRVSQAGDLLSAPLTDPSTFTSVLVVTPSPTTTTTTLPMVTVTGDPEPGKI